MRVFVTGGAGFVGSHVVDALIKEGHEVTVYDNLEKGYKENVNSQAKFILGDLKDKETLSKEIAGHDAVIHMAAESIIKDSISNPEEFIKKNINYAINLLEAMRQNKINKIVFSSSAAVYGETEDRPVKEDSKKEPMHPYGASKLAIENILSGYFHAFGINSISLRYFNVYGPRDDQLPVTRAVPNWIKLTLLNKPSKLYWKGKQLRDYIFAKDVASAHVLTLKNCDGLNVYNVGSGNGARVLDILEAVFKALGKKGNVVDAGERKGDAHRLVANTNKIKKELGWAPKYSLEEGMKETVEFYKTHPESLKRI